MCHYCRNKKMNDDISCKIVHLTVQNISNKIILLIIKKPKLFCFILKSNELIQFILTLFSRESYLCKNLKNCIPSSAYFHENYALLRKCEVFIIFSTTTNKNAIFHPKSIILSNTMNIPSYTFSYVVTGYSLRVTKIQT